MLDFRYLILLFDTGYTNCFRTVWRWFRPKIDLGISRELFVSIVASWVAIREVVFRNGNLLVLVRVRHGLSVVGMLESWRVRHEWLVVSMTLCLSGRLRHDWLVVELTGFFDVWNEKSDTMERLIWEQKTMLAIMPWY